MTVVFALFAVVIFAITFRLSGLYGTVLDAVATAKQAVQVVGDRSLADDEKEQRVRTFAVNLLKRFVQITILGTVVLTLPLVSLMLFDFLGFVSYHDVMELLLGWQMIVVLSLLFVVIWVVRK